jgi:hypothetical protein
MPCEAALAVVCGRNSWRTNRLPLDDVLLRESPEGAKADWMGPPERVHASVGATS